MGLDMYAYTVKNELVGNQQIDINTHRTVLNHVGFKNLTDDELNQIDQKERYAYWENRDQALTKAHEDGIWDSDFAYWRKFNHLHGWMENLYSSKGGDQEFNCTTVRLMPEDIDELEKAADHDQLTPTSGFFFGSDKLYPEDVESLKEFITKSREAINNGYAVLYDSWW